MANDFMTSEQARAQLDQIDVDQRHLTSSIDTPWPLMAAAGATLAWFVAEAGSARPGAGYQPSDGWLLAAGVLFLVVYAIRRETGVRFRRVSGKGLMIAIGLMVWTLAMFSVALALVSLGHRWWVAVPALLTWVVGTVGSGAYYRSCVQAMRRG